MNSSAAPTFQPLHALENYNLTSIHEIGLNGLSELCGLNPAFYEFQSTLFGRSLLDKDRELLDSAEISKISAIIDKFLHLLSPYFATRPAQKALEFLVRHFK